MAEDVAAHVLHDALAGHLHDVGLQEADAEGEHQREQEQERDAPEARGVARRDVAVDRHLGEVGPGQVDPGLRHDQQERDEDGPRVRPQVAEQPPQQAEVVARGCERIVVVGAHAASSPVSISCSSSWRRLRSA